MEINWDSETAASAIGVPGIDASTVVLITGGSGAIGKRCAEAFLGLGAKVAIMSRTQASVDAAKQELGHGDDVLAIAGDISVEEDATRAVDAVVAAFGHVDVLVNSAAIGGNFAIEDATAERIDKFLAANVKGALLMARAAAAPMKAQGHGRIVMVSSIMGHRTMPNSFLYGTTKAAVAHATRGLAADLGQFGITVNCVSPANTPTALRAVDEAPGTPNPPPTHIASSADKIPLRRRGEFDDYVGPIVFFASDLSRYVTGADVLADGGLALIRA